MQKRYLLLGITVLLFACNNIAKRNDIPDNRLINEIIRETIKQDSLDTSVPMSNKLISYYFYSVEIEKNSSLEFPPPPPPLPPTTNGKGKPLNLYYFRLYQTKLIGYTINAEDSIFFERQFTKAQNIVLDSIKFKDIIRVEDNTNRQPGKFRSQEIFEFFIPLFNRDKTIVWVEYNYRCPACGYGRLVIFKKTNNGWLRIDSYETWTN
jgi:hypothetical protein